MRRKIIPISTGSIILSLIMFFFSFSCYGAGFSASDLSGTWSVCSYYIEPDFSSMGYTRGSGTFGGQFAFSETESDGSSDAFSGTVQATITSDGIVTVTPQGDPGFEGYMNGSKNVIASVNNADGDFNLIASVKMAGSYSAADLSGTWYLASFWIDDAFQDIGYTRGSGTFGGNFSMSEYDSVDGEASFTVPVSATITPGGLVTLTPTGSPSFESYMNASKDVLISVNNADEDFAFGVAVKKVTSYSAQDLSGTWCVCSYFVGENLDFLGFTRGSGTLGAAFSLSDTESDGGSDSYTETVQGSITSDGIVTITPQGEPGFEGHMNASKDVIVSVNRDDGDINLIIVLKSDATPSSAPAADFLATAITGLAPLTVDFTDTSSGDVGTWSWNFGDGETSSQASPSHTYRTPGTYTVGLTVSGPGGEDTETKTDYITVKPRSMSWMLLLGDD